MSSQVEVLVHVSGPSRGPDDARYRKEARAFLDFDVAERHPITTLSSTHDSQINTHSTLLTESDQRNTVESTPSLSPSQRIRAIRQLWLAKTNLTTPNDKAAARGPQGNAASRNFIHPTSPWTSVKETPRILQERTPAAACSQPALDERPPKRSSQLRRVQSDSWETPPSVIPDSQPPQEPQISSSPVHRYTNTLSSSFDEPASSPTAKRARRSSPAPRQALAPIHSALTSSQDLRPPEPASSQRTISSQASEPTLPQTIVPKTKPTFGNAKFTTHKTKYLRWLAQQPALKLAKIHCSTSRPVDKLERGHWRITLSTWSIGAKVNFWKVLTDLIGAGKAGCIGHVYCTWEKAEKAAASSSEKENHSPGNEQVALIYCWGEVILEIFLLIYTASGNEMKTKGLQASWIDAEGNAIGTVTGLYLMG